MHISSFVSIHYIYLIHHCIYSLLYHFIRYLYLQMWLYAVYVNIKLDVNLMIQIFEIVICENIFDCTLTSHF